MGATPGKTPQYEEFGDYFKTDRERLPVKGLVNKVLKTIEATLDKYVIEYDVVSSLEDYKKLKIDEDGEKKPMTEYDILVGTYSGPVLTHVLEDQLKENKRLKWIQSVSTGID